jgi:hypothetical protein
MTPYALSPAAARRQRRELMAQIARDEKRKQRQHLAALRAQVRQARVDRKAALEEARARCRAERLSVRQRVEALRQRVLQELRDAVAAERAEARQTCTVRRTAARAISDQIKRVRAELEAERAFQRDMRRIESANRHRTQQAHRASAAERRSESDDAVRASIPDELVPLWERVKRSIHGSDRMSRAEIFMKYAEEHPEDVLLILEDRTDALVRELEARERDAAAALRHQSALPEDPFAELGPPSQAADSVPF